MNDRFARMALVSRLAVAVVLAVAGMVLAANGLPGPSALSGTAVQSSVMIQLDGTRPLADVLMDLAVAGFPSTAKAEFVPERFNYRLVFVPNADDATFTALRAVAGVAAVRRVYSVSGFEAPLLHTGEVIIKLKANAPAGTLEGLLTKYSGTITRQFEWLPGGYLVRVPDTAASDAMTVAKAVVLEAGVEYCHANTLLGGFVGLDAVDIQDPLFPFQWHLSNKGQFPGATPGADVNAVAAWEITQGAGAILAIIDDCVQRDHEDLKDNYITGYDFTDNDGDPGPELDDAHGVACAGLAVARGNNIGVRGVAPEAGLIGIRALGTLSKRPPDFASMAQAFIFAEANGAQVISNSWHYPYLPVPNGFNPWDPVVAPPPQNIIDSALRTITTTGRSGRGVLVMFSSGNSGTEVAFDNPLAALPYTMAIGATNRDDRLTCYSSFGDAQSIVAPGGGGSPSNNTPTSVCYEADMTTTDVQDLLFPIDPADGLRTILGYNPAVSYLYTGIRVIDRTVIDYPNTAYHNAMNGTSAACPVAAGVAALVFSVNPSITAREAKNLLEHTAKKVTFPDLHYDAVTGHNTYMGHGRVDALAAVLAAQAAKSWPSPVTNIQNISSPTLARLFWSNPDWDGDGTADEDVAGDLVVRGLAGQLEWGPVDGIIYDVGQQVAPGVIVVANDLITALDQTGLPQGDYEYAIFVRNAANYYSWGRRTSFNSSGSTTVPKASIQASVTSGSAPLSIHFAGGGIDATGLVSMNWTFGDGRTGSGPAIDHTYTSAGRYTATLKVTNTGGLTAQTTVIINVLSGTNAVPVASIQATPTSGQVPLPVVFQASATDSDGRVVRYDWNFGDGSVATGQTVEHIYLDAGTYGVTLTAVDNSGGEGMESVLITVTNSSTTAAQTVGTTATNLLPTCGAGASAAMMATSIGLLGLMALRRRR